MKNKCILLVLVLVVLFSYQVVFAESTVDCTKEADMLNSLGLFNGTNNGYELDRVPKRVEAAAMLVRLLGAEDDANKMNYKHPFTDVPEWADAIVGYMYENGYTKGISDSLFGSEQTTIARDYSTFMLRTIGYGDNDFNYEDALNFAVSKGIIASDEAQSLQEQKFRRNEMVLISYRTLKAPVKDESSLLAEKLVEANVITAQKALDAGIVDYKTLPIKIWKKGLGSRYNIYISRTSPELIDAFSGTSSSNNFLDFNNKEFLAKYSILTDYEKRKKIKNRYKYDAENVDMLDMWYYSDSYEIAIFRDDDLVMSNYAIIPFNAVEGEYNVVIQPISEELKNLILASEEEFKQYKAEEVKKIAVISSNAYKIKKGDEGKYFITIDRTKLPESMKNFKYYGQSGCTTDNIDKIIDKMLKKFFAHSNAHRGSDEYVDGEPIEILYNGYDRFTLLDENQNVIGITVLVTE